MSKHNDMLVAMQESDPQVQSIVAYSKFVVVYLLQQDGANPGWRKANIEGPVYVARRRVAPYFQLVSKNQNSDFKKGSTQSLSDYFHPSWELDCQKNYIFYKVEDTSKRIRGLWFPDDGERQIFEAELQKFLQEIRSQPEPGPAPQESQLEAFQEQPQRPAQPKANAQAAARGSQTEGSECQTEGKWPGSLRQMKVTTPGLSATLHSLADDDYFLNAVMQSLAQNQGW